MFAQMQFGFWQEIPATRTATTTTERIADLKLQTESGVTVSLARPRHRVQHTERDLACQMRRQRLDVGIGGRLAFGLGHARSIAGAAG